ncbi:hypothetical protein SASPL_157279 [Salvia splendens]|uniref:Uncharacterized protein n=1 Tax=Salvia splendens TaxID=180675 RepID=A0A8X8VV78_SALSN|nr:hypothetical protein SASPL_157279 [Salvia splendens]
MKHALMNDENRPSNLGEPTARVTRARAKFLGSSSGLPLLYPSAKHDDKRVSRASLKRAAPDKSVGSSAACHPNKKRAVLKDVTNVNCEKLYINCINAAKGQVRTPIRQDRKGSLQKKGKVEPACFAKGSQVLEVIIENIVDELSWRDPRVSEEYELVPDTLYLTVNLLDRFLSENYIEKQKLQLSWCNMHANCIVVEMESRVLNLLKFQLSVPTTKKFLRRFIQAAQASYKVPSVELEFLANYLAELTLVEYSFLKYLPSVTAASAIFLARWTLDQSDDPWNPTLEHYTRHKASELKSTVLELQELQLNTKGGMLNAIREKYKHLSVSRLCAHQNLLSHSSKINRASFPASLTLTIDVVNQSALVLPEMLL